VFDSEALGEHHVLDDFNSGVESLDRWLKETARHADRKRQSRTFVWCEEGPTVVAYFTLAPHIIRRTELPAKVGRGDLNEIPAILLARLALHVKHQGQGLGAELLIDALSRAVSASDQVGGRYVVVDALDKRAGLFYKRYGFIECVGDVALRYTRKVSDIALSLEL
jgi:predicted N-acetyltransferase YhbS